MIKVDFPALDVPLSKIICPSAIAPLFFEPPNEITILKSLLYFSDGIFHHNIMAENSTIKLYDDLRFP